MATNQQLLVELRKQLDDLKTDLSQRDQRLSYVDARVEHAAAEMQTTMRTSFDTDTIKHREYIVSLYSKFERLVYVLVVLAVAVVTYFGFRISDIPESVDRQVNEIVQGIEVKLNTKLQQEMAAVEKKVEGRVTDLKAELQRSLDAAKESVGFIEASKAHADGQVEALESIIENARKEQSGAKEEYGRLLTRNKQTLERLGLDLALVKLDAELPDTRDEIEDLWNNVGLAIVNDVAKVDKLMDVVSTVSNDVFTENRSSMRERFDRIVKQNTHLQERLPVLRAGLLLGHRKTEDAVRVRLKSDEATKVLGAMRLFRDERYIVVGGMRRHRVRRGPDSGQFVGELVGLAGNVRNVAIARGAVEVLKIDKLLVEQRRKLHQVLAQWLTVPELKTAFLGRVLRRMPLDEAMSEFVGQLLDPQRQSDRETRDVITARLIGRLVETRGERARRFVGLLDKRVLLRHADVQGKLAVEFVTGRDKQTQRFRVVGGAVVAVNGGELLLTVGGKRVSLSGVTLIRGEGRDWNMQVESVQVDGKPVADVTFPKSGRSDVYTRAGESIVLKAIYGYRGNVDIAAAVVE